MKFNPVKLLVLCGVMLLGLSHVQAQNKKSKKDKSVNVERIVDGDNISLELNINDNDGRYKTLALGDEGAVIYYEKKNPGKGADACEFIKFNKDLEEEYRKEYVLAKDNSIFQTIENEGKVYFLVGKKKGSASAFGVFLEKYTIVRFDPKEKEFKSFEGTLNNGGYMSGEMKIVKGVAYMNILKGHSPKKMQLMMCLNTCTCFIPMFTGLMKFEFKSELLIHDLNEKKQKNVDLGYKKRKGTVAISSFSVNEDNGEVTLLMSAKEKKFQLLWFKNIESNGKPGKDINIKLPPGKVLTDIKSDVMDGKKVFFGQYGESVQVKVFSRTPGPPGGTTQGIVFGVVGATAVDKLSMIAYNKIKNFKFPTTSKEARQMKRKSKKGKEAGINLKVHFIEPLQYNDEIILVGEVYYATYRTEIEFYTDAQGRTRTRTVVVFDGWAFSNILVTSFNLKGELLWSNSIPYTRAKSFYIYDRINATLQEDGAVRIVYNNGFDLMTTLISENNIVDGKKYSIKGIKKGDKVKAAGVSGDGADVNYWYGDYYIASGLLDLKNKEKKGKDKKRSIYYVKRIEIAEE